MPGWDAALDAMRDLSHAFKSPDYHLHLAGFAESLVRHGTVFNAVSGELEAASDTPHNRARINQLINGALAIVETAEPVWVAADVVALVQHAAEHPTFKAQAIDLDMLWTREAFCLLETPLVIEDVNGLEMRYRALSWSVTVTGPDNPAENGILMAYWAHRDDSDGYYDAENGKLHPHDKGELHFPGRELPGGKLPLLGGSPFQLLHVDHIPFGEDRFMSIPAMAQGMAQLESLWRLSQRKVVMYGPERTSRATWKRASNWRQIKEVTVLRLRRARYVTHYEGDGEGRELTVRFNVRGHWRDHYYASLGPVGDPKAYRQIWVDEYLKGPEDAPLILKRHATEFTR